MNQRKNNLIIKMKYRKEYQDYIKNITDVFVGKLTRNTSRPIEEYYTPKYKKNGGLISFDFQVDSNENIIYIYDESPTEMGGVIIRPKDVVEAWVKIENEYALKWLKKNLITYDEYVVKHKEKDYSIS